MKLALAAILLFVLVGSLVVELQVVMANPYIPPSEPVIELPALIVQAPQNFTTYNTDGITLNFTVTRPGRWFYYTQFQEISYTLDEGKMQVLFLREQKANLGDGDGLDIINQYFVPIDGLTQGEHILEVKVVAVAFYIDQPHLIRLQKEFETTEKIYLTIDKVIPSILIHTPENKTYDEGGFFPLNFTINEPASWMGYSLDNKANTTLNGNTTIDVQAGFHTLTVYANDTAGNMGTSNLVEFTLQPNLPRPTNSPTSSPTQQPTLEPTLTPWLEDGHGGLDVTRLIIASLLTLVAIVGIAVFLRKRSKK